MLKTIIINKAENGWQVNHWFYEPIRPGALTISLKEYLYVFSTYEEVLAFLKELNDTTTEG
jgi:hypothetical protein